MHIVREKKEKTGYVNQAKRPKKAVPLPIDCP
ncbi:hypothetical protein B23_3760 [Geobacillus thermoleovorans B23]|nr:hypothetical protein B23_3760 [Geobacillus thermoleovorans B23]